MQTKRYCPRPIKNNTLYYEKNNSAENLCKKLLIDEVILDFDVDMEIAKNEITSILYKGDRNNFRPEKISFLTSTIFRPTYDLEILYDSKFLIASRERMTLFHKKR